MRCVFGFGWNSGGEDICYITARKTKRRLHYFKGRGVSSLFRLQCVIVGERSKFCRVSTLSREAPMFQHGVKNLNDKPKKTIEFFKNNYFLSAFQHKVGFHILVCKIQGKLFSLKTILECSNDSVYFVIYVPWFSTDTDISIKMSNSHSTGHNSVMQNVILAYNIYKTIFNLSSFY